MLRGLLDAGMDAARFNLSYGTHEEHARTLALLRDLAGEMGRQVAVLFDLPGPKLRTGPLPGGAVDLRVGETVRLVPIDCVESAECGQGNYCLAPVDVCSGRFEPTSCEAYPDCDWDAVSRCPRR